MIKSYVYKHAANPSKINIIENIIYPQWLKIYKILINNHFTHFYQFNKISESNKIYQPIISTLSERYKDAINQQAKGQVKSKISNTKLKFTKYVNKNVENPQIKKSLHTINKLNLFFHRTDFQYKTLLITKEEILIARKIFKRILGHLPGTNNLNMLMQGKICAIEESLMCKNPDFKYILKLSCHIKGKPIYVPLLNNPYADKFNGTLSTCCNFVFKNNKLLKINLFKDVPKPVNNSTPTKISIDIGLKVLIATNKGDLFGKKFLNWLKRKDKQLQELIKDLKFKYGEKIKLSTFSEFNRLNKRIKDYTKNEVNRIFNRILKIYNPSEISLEDLDFQKSKLSKQMNRLLSRFGLGNITNKLKDLEEFRGLRINYVCAAYSSQVCSKCKYVDKKNRTTQEQFECRCCGNKLNADINGSRTVEYFSKRFGCQSFNSAVERGNKLKFLIMDFLEDSNYLKFWSNNLSVVQLLNKNPYFKDSLITPYKALE